MTDEEREFYMEMRHGLLVQVEAIEKRYLPDKHAETLAMRQWLREQKRDRVNSSQRN